jgi:hypothetical protein
MMKKKKIVINAIQSVIHVKLIVVIALSVLEIELTLHSVIAQFIMQILISKY